MFAFQTKSVTAPLLVFLVATTGCSSDLERSLIGHEPEEDAGAPPTGVGPYGASDGSAGGVGFGNTDQKRGDSGESLGADAACAVTKLRPGPIERDVETERTVECIVERRSPLSLYIVLDNSSSMDQANRWQNAVQAISEFVDTANDPRPRWICTDEDGQRVTRPAGLPPATSGPISVALQYFHPPNEPGADECDGTAHATPAVDMAPLPGNAPAIVDSLNSTETVPWTPTVGALRGGTAYCARYQTAQPEDPCVVVLVTDGQPNGCGLNAGGGGAAAGEGVDPNAEAVLTPIARSAFANANNSVRTFAIGMDGVSAEGFLLLDRIAAAGGSDCTPGRPGEEACDVSTGGAQGFLDALNAIRESIQVTETETEAVTMTTTETVAVPCEWEIPHFPAGETFDKDLVNVVLTARGTSQRIGKVESKADCSGVADGWYYDDESDPERLIACPETCSKVEADENAMVDVLFGCMTEPASVR